MDAWFLKLLNMSAAGSILILAVVVLRALLRKAPRWIVCAMWALVAIRLVCPFSIPSPLSAFQATPSIVGESGEVEVFRPAGGSEKPLVVVDTVQIERPRSSTETIREIPGTAYAVTQRSRDAYLPPLELVYLLGLAAMLLYAVVSTLALRKRVSASLRQRGDIRICDELASPFILGIVRPTVYLPSSLSEEEQRYVLAHERAHLRRLDHIWKPLGFLILSIHWFDPFCWLAYVLLCRDIELACDEKVIRELGRTERAAYSQTLLNCSAHRILAACPVAFGETDVKTRVKAVLNYKKPAFWIVLAAVLGCIVLIVCFAAKPLPSEPDLSFLNYKNAIPLIGQNGTAPYADLYPADSGGVQPGVADSKALAQFLESANWTQRRAPSSSPEPRGFIEFMIEDDYRIILYQSERLAAVCFGNDVRYYRTAAGDYEAALAAFIPAPSTAPDRVPEGKTATELLSSDPLAFLHSFANGQILTVIDNTGRQYTDRAKSFDEIVSAQTWTVRETHGFPASDPDRVIQILCEDFPQDVGWALRFEESGGEMLCIASRMLSSLDTVWYLDCGEDLMDELMAWALARQQEGTTSHRMTLNDVYALADKGLALTWSDLLAFEGEEIGSGQLIWRFPIDDSYCLEAYDGELDGPPEHVFLLKADENGEFRPGPGLYIDIFTQDIDAFLAGAHTQSVTISSGGATIEPVLYLLNEKIWTDYGWLFADGEPLTVALGDQDKIPTLTLADDLLVRFEGYSRKSGLQIYDEQYELLRGDWYGDTAVNWLAPGRYYGVIEVYGPAGRYIASEGACEESVYRAVFRLNVASEGAEPYTPEKAVGSTRASLHTIGGDYVIADAESLAKLETWLKNAEAMPGGTGCPFGSVLTLTLADGSTISCCPAEDSCGIVFANGAFYRFAHDNEDFWRLFGIQQR
ncbi:MAG: M56 family metallopeptidase [Oscillospiraceae bacterium]|nr:M56 family metallopeptidase [Oscillospiraceae bacterium]